VDLFLHSSQCLYGKNRGTSPFTLYKISGQPLTYLMFNKLRIVKHRKSSDIWGIKMKEELEKRI
jgi:hypothetical protein